MQSKGIAAVAVIVVAALVIAGVWYALGTDDSEQGADTVTDALGREVPVPESADGVVCLSAGSARMVCYLGAFDRIVGIDDQDAGAIGQKANYYMATYRIAYDFSSVPNVGSEDNFRGIMATGADLIVTSMTDRSEVDTLQSNTGIPVIAVSAAGNIDVDDAEFDANLWMLGKAMGLGDRAEELIEGKDRMLAELKGLADASDAQASFYIGGMFYMMQGGFDMTTGNYASLEYVGFDNAMPDTNSGNPYTTDFRSIAGSGAGYILVDSMTLSSSEKSFSDNRDVLSGLEAVSEGRIYSTLVYKYYGTNWESQLMNAYFIGSLVDPGTFDYDLEQAMDRVLGLFYPGSGLTYGDVCQHQTGYTHLDW